MAFTHALVALLTSLMAMLSLAILAAGIWLSTLSPSTRCIRFLQWPLPLLGLLLLLVSSLGLYAALSRSTRLLWSYCLSLTLLSLATCLFLLFANTTTVDAPSFFKNYAELRFGNYYTWLHRQVYKETAWHKVTSCIAHTHTCRDMYEALGRTGDTHNFSPIQSGCCKPPTGCNLAFGANMATTTSPSNESSVLLNADCGLWSGNQSELCYSCDSCKVGVLGHLTKELKPIAVVNFMFVAFMSMAQVLSCCALTACRRRNNKLDTTERV